MKNQYVGDIGDYGKYGLLRFLSARGTQIGVNWYLTPDDDSADGKFTRYLENPENKIYDPALFDNLRVIANRENKTIQMVEEAGIIPGAAFYHEVLQTSSLEVKARELARQLWFNNSKLMLKGADLIFADPDNGLSFTKGASNKDGEKYILPEEICEYYHSGSNVVYYCHKGRRTDDQWEKAKTQIREYIRDAQILAVTSHRGTQRSYVFILHPDCFHKYNQLLREFVESSWGPMFSWESVGGNICSECERKERNCEKIK